MSETTTGSEPSRWRRWLIEASIFVVVLTSIQLWQLRDAARGLAPEISAEMVDGRHFNLSEWRATHPDSALLLYFWAEWCPVCKTTAGTVSNIAADWPVTTIAVQSGDAAAVARHMQAAGNNWPTVNDPQGELLRQYGLPGTPSFAILSPDGEIHFVAMGYTSEIGLRLRLWWANQKTK